MNNSCCGNCSYYLRHYALDKRKIFRIYCGHCTMGRPKKKLPDTKACENFRPGPAQEEAFVSKEYLSKELLQYVLNLDLLPEIEERG